MSLATPTNAELLTVLQAGLRLSRQIAGLRRRPFAYRTSFPVEEVDLEFDDGTTVPLLFKDLSRDTLSEEARRAKPAFLHEPGREVEVYRSVLPLAPLGPPVCYGSAADAATGRYWLLLERVTGRELYQVGEFETWKAAARWLAGLHTHFANREPPAACLIAHDADYYRIWPQRAMAFVPAAIRRRLEGLVGQYDVVVERMLSLASTLLHGEFYASNVPIQDRPGEPRVCPVDWEMAAWGPGLFDLAALTAGKWTEAERTALARAYHAELADSKSFDELLADLVWCRLQLAVQWLGWSPEWVPPAEHAHDWLGEALHLAEKLGL